MITDVSYWPEEDLTEYLADADKLCAIGASDAFETLGWAAMHISAGRPLSPHIGAWLVRAVEQYQLGSGSFDAALGLDLPGRANPRRQARAHEACEAALGEMLNLHALGATVPQAAAMATCLGSQFAPSTLERKFRRSWMAKQARAMRVPMPRAAMENILARYPDENIEVAQGKASVRAMYAKHGL